uniref:Predicted nucleotide-binding protein containing TIR-like domain-containing protein n=1 Tax=Candidatus Kentrum sp. LFY TaxID=2126342 RepID=A0A450UFF1_9GAMM|nr:MAG: Predicted nucleotide-binding protein containing TIR-like domain-containing protein [Candidatus Kentron sp. LFY]
MAEKKIFIGSASESLHIVDGIVESLKNNIIPIPWTVGASKPTETILQNLLDKKWDVDFACFVFDPQDKILSKGEEKDAARDNVIFEIGLFIGMLGAKRTFIVFPEGNMPKLLTDLYGITMIPIRHEAWEQDNPQSIRLINAAISIIKRRIGELGKITDTDIEVTINSLEKLRETPESEVSETIILERFFNSIPNFIQCAARRYNKNPINLSRDVCLYIDSPFEIQDVKELAYVQGNLEGEKEIWVFAMRILDVKPPIYKAAENNIRKGVRYVYFQYEIFNYKKLIKKLEADIGKQEEWKGAAICIVVPREVLMPCDYLIYDPNWEKQKGYVGKSAKTKEHLLIELNESNVQHTIDTWEGYVAECWEKYEADGTTIFHYKP